MDLTDRDARQTTPRRPSSVRFGVLGLLGLVASCAYLTRHCIAVANTSIQSDLGIDDEVMGWVLGAFSAGYFFFQIPGGWLGNRIGTRAAFPLICTLWSLLTVWSSFAFSWVSLVASRAFYGSAQAGLTPLSAKIINDWFSVRRRGFCSAVVGASMSLGGVLALGLTAQLMEHYHWRAIFRIYSLVGIAWAVAFFWYFRTTPEEHPRVNDAELDLINDRVTDRDDDDEKAAPKGFASSDGPRSLTNAELFRRLATNRTIWAIYAQAFQRAAGYGLFVTWLPALLEYRHGISSVESGMLSTLPLVGVIVGTLLGGVAVDLTLQWTGSKWLSRSGIGFVALAACGLVTWSSLRAGSPIEFVLLLSAGSLCSGLANPPAWAATMDVSGRHTAVIFGAMNMASTLGGFTMPVVLGYMIGDIRKAGGNWDHVIHFVVAVYVIGAVCWLAVDPNDAPEAAGDE